jgi:aldose 1-epimerase
MDIKNTIFGYTKNNEEVIEYTLTNDNGSSVSILNYGGIITKLLVPNKEGVLTNVVLGNDTVQQYETASPYFGCITGRVAGRIANATFTLEGVTYLLDKNDGENSLHGGLVGFDKVLWSAATSVSADRLTLTLNYLSPDDDQGFPGTLDVFVIYTFDNNQTLSITYEATTDKATPITLTNHTYFNLSGDPASTILDHELRIDADNYVIVAPDTIPTGLGPVTGTPFDFRQAKPIGQDIHVDTDQINFAGGYDHAFELNKDSQEPIELFCATSGIRLKMTTNENCVVCYTGNYLTDKYVVAGEIPVQKNSAVCLETQDYPNAINADFFPTDAVLKPKERYKKITSFAFSL